MADWDGGLESHRRGTARRTMKRMIAAVVCVAMAFSGNARGEPPAADAAKKVYDKSADARKQISDAIAAAKPAGKRVLIQWGATGARGACD